MQGQPQITVLINSAGSMFIFFVCIINYVKGHIRLDSSITDPKLLREEPWARSPAVPLTLYEPRRVHFLKFCFFHFSMEMIVRLNVMLRAKPSVHDKHNLHHLPKTFVVFPLTLKLTDTPKKLYEINMCVCVNI